MFERSSRSHSATCTDVGIGRQASLRNWCLLQVCGFESRSVHHYALLAQLVEQRTFNPWGMGSIPIGRTRKIFERG